MKRGREAASDEERRGEAAAATATGELPEGFFDDAEEERKAREELVSQAKQESGDGQAEEDVDAMLKGIEQSMQSEARAKDDNEDGGDEDSDEDEEDNEGQEEREREKQAAASVERAEELGREVAAAVDVQSARRAPQAMETSTEAPQGSTNASTEDDSDEAIFGNDERAWCTRHGF